MSSYPQADEYFGDLFATFGIAMATAGAELERFAAAIERATPEQLAEWNAMLEAAGPAFRFTDAVEQLETAQGVSEGELDSIRDGILKLSGEGGQ